MKPHLVFCPPTLLVLLTACASSPQLQAKVWPRYVCGETRPVLSWQASRATQVVVTDARGRTVYDSGEPRSEESQGRLASVDREALPLSVRYADSTRPLEIGPMPPSESYAKVAPTELEYEVYETPLGLSASELGPLAEVSAPTPDPGRRCSNRAPNGQCLDITSVNNELHEVGVALRKAIWSLEEVFGTEAKLQTLKNSNPDVVLIAGRQRVPPGGSLDLDAVAPEGLRIIAELSSAFRRRCGMETRYDDGSCAASGGMTACRAQGGDDGFRLCAITALAIEVDATCE